MENVTFDDFKKLNIKIGQITSAKKHENANKLLVLQIDLGSETRQIIAGGAEFHKPESLIGKQVPVLLNIAPKMIRGIEGHGILLAVDFNNQPCFLTPEEQVPVGSIVK